MNNNFDPNTNNTNGGTTPESPLYYDLGPIAPEKKSSNGFAIASLVLGILSIVCCCLYPVALAFGILTIIFSVVSRRQAGHFNGLATAGLILGIIGTVLGAYFLIDAIINPVSQEELDAIWKEYEAMLNGGGITTALRTLFHL